VENAVKYSGNSVKISAYATLTDTEVTIAVSDNGNGIAASDLRHIFQRFYRGKASATDLPGIGLGLTYVRLLVGAHGGSVSVDSTEGVGTCFTIKLPR
ncbi:MAG: ATP-binding protein, partial [Muribaculaceae bacterium]|nr:ATP-binding protein [Muribaculaceae bacterium]